MLTSNGPAIRLYRNPYPSTRYSTETKSCRWQKNYSLTYMQTSIHVYSALEYLLFFNNLNHWIKALGGVRVLQLKFSEGGKSMNTLMKFIGFHLSPHCSVMQVKIMNKLTQIMLIIIIMLQCIISTNIMCNIYDTGIYDTGM